MMWNREWQQRFLRAVDNITLAANLPRVADKKVVARYQKLLEAESGSLRSPLDSPPSPLSTVSPSSPPQKNSGSNIHYGGEPTVTAHMTTSHKPPLATASPT